VSPGYLQKTCDEKGRRYYHYQMEGEMDMFFSIVSARYAVKRDVWTSPDGKQVNIEIFYHPPHTYNLDRFVGSVKASMDGLLQPELHAVPVPADAHPGISALC